MSVTNSVAGRKPRAGGHSARGDQGMGAARKSTGSREGIVIRPVLASGADGPYVSDTHEQRAVRTIPAQEADWSVAIDDVLAARRAKKSARHVVPVTHGKCARGAGDGQWTGDALSIGAVPGNPTEFDGHTTHAAQSQCAVEAASQGRPNIQNPGAGGKLSKKRGHVDRDAHSDHAARETGQIASDAQRKGAGLARSKNSLGHGVVVTHSADAEANGRDCVYGTVTPDYHAHAIGAVLSLHREHRGLEAARGDMDRRLKGEARWAATRRFKAAGGVIETDLAELVLDDEGNILKKKIKFPPVLPEDTAWVESARTSFIAVRDFTEKLRREAEKKMVDAASSLPGFRLTAEIRGFGTKSFAAIVGEAGDIGSYANPAKLWKRMGLAVINGKSQRKTKNAEEAKLMGYAPRRRSEMFVIGDSLVKTGGPLGELYRKRKEYEIATQTAKGIQIIPGAKYARLKDKTGFMSAMHIHRRAQRYAEKRLLRELWKAWRADCGVNDNTIPEFASADAGRTAAEEAVTPTTLVPPSETLREANGSSLPVVPVPRVKRAYTRRKAA